jgi:hypothetical protein
MLSERNGMILSNLVSTFAPCIISQATPSPSTTITPINTYVNEHRGISLDDMDLKYNKIQEDNLLFDDEDETQDSLGLLINTSSPAKLKRNQSLQCKNQTYRL